MRSYLAATDPPRAQFAAVFLMLRGPGFEPVIRPGFGREGKVMERNMLRDNWWSLSFPKPADANAVADTSLHEALAEIYGGVSYIPPDFLAKDERTSGELQWAKLVADGGNGVNYLCGQSIAWSQSHGEDVRVPQALHECVVATHYGPADKASSALSKQAFDILHRRYPNSEWTKQTKYWY